jgi:hypothetical protein
LWIVFAESVIGYGGFFFSLDGVNETVKEKFRIVYRKSLKYILNLNKNTQSDLAYHIARVITPEMLSNVRYLSVAKSLLTERGIFLEPWIRQKILDKVA